MLVIVAPHAQIYFYGFMKSFCLLNSIVRSNGFQCAHVYTNVWLHYFRLLLRIVFYFIFCYFRCTHIDCDDSEDLWRTWASHLLKMFGNRYQMHLFRLPFFLSLSKLSSWIIWTRDRNTLHHTSIPYKNCNFSWKLGEISRIFSPAVALAWFYRRIVQFLGHTPFESSQIEKCIYSSNNPHNNCKNPIKYRLLWVDGTPQTKEIGEKEQFHKHTHAS